MNSAIEQIEENARRALGLLSDDASSKSDAIASAAGVVSAAAGGAAIAKAALAQVEATKENFAASLGAAPKTPAPAPEETQATGPEASDAADAATPAKKKSEILSSYSAGNPGEDRSDMAMQALVQVTGQDGTSLSQMDETPAPPVIPAIEMPVASQATPLQEAETVVETVSQEAMDNAAGIMETGGAQTADLTLEAAPQVIEATEQTITSAGSQEELIANEVSAEKFPGPLPAAPVAAPTQKKRGFFARLFGLR